MCIECMYVYLHEYGVYMCVYLYVHLCMCMGIYVCASMYMHLCMCVYSRVDGSCGWIYGVGVVQPKTRYLTWRLQYRLQLMVKETLMF